ncbi:MULTISPECIES: carbonate dehydratase [Ferrimonas]|uniref:carbonate dehydratase n=1 Tax=Ferrimonas TaxID=44011 RepID=UPI000425DE9C|nr:MULTISPECIES: carbonate dehydratase [Ferrimonas]USD35868.1 carbonate dehydratase [Ferrimonas sp. SCSIO 43195]
MSNLEHLFQRNREWANRIQEENPEFFSQLAQQQNPEYLWIGCSDSRVPANQIIDLAPGEIFVHRNIANVVVHSDLNCLSVIEFAIDVLKVKHIIVCGHYGCSGVKASMEADYLGLASNWLRHVRDTYEDHKLVLDEMSEEERANRLCELNVIDQAANVCQTTIVKAAWDRGQELTVHSWIYGLKDGHIHDLGLKVNGRGQVFGARKAAMEAINS